MDQEFLSKLFLIGYFISVFLNIVLLFSCLYDSLKKRKEWTLEVLLDEYELFPYLMLCLTGPVFLLCLIQIFIRSHAHKIKFGQDQDKILAETQELIDKIDKIKEK